jgi:predicted chitinase
MNTIYYGIVENRQDPLRLGRCQVRIVGLHTHDKSQLSTADLPWATPLQPITSAAMNGIGYTPIGPVEGTSVIVMFADAEMQQPIILGTVGGIPNTPGPIDTDDSAPIGEGAVVRTENITLRTIPGPVNGKQLTLFDPENPSVNLTSVLKANMKVLGFGLPDNTFIVSIDSPTQFTINNPVTNYGENILSFEDPPTNLAALNASRLQNILVDSSGTPVTSGDGTPIRIGSAEPSPVKNTPVNEQIPTIPPPKSTPNVQKSIAGIKALIAACDKVGLTTLEQKCALLGIAGGESRWIPQLESFNYSPTRLKQVYSFATPEDIDTFSNASRKGVTREQFFSWAYGPTKRGKGFLGNRTDEDGGKYYGRGFIQLTGRANYQRYQNLANQMGLQLDIINNPDSLDADINVSALVAALYFKDRVKGVKANAHPDYYLAAKKAVGVNTPDIAALKRSYYEYFYGKTAAGSGEKDAGAPTATPPVDNDPTPRPSEQSIRTGADNTGFRDPNSKYPLQEYIGEADTNRLARGVIQGTVVTKKDATRIRSVPKALDLGTWDQPEAPFGAKYPFNKVFETESGHIQEFDDTPGQERIHTYHRSGTFTEVDVNGTQVNYIVGDNFVLMEKNGCVHVAGECNITVDGNTNIYARTDANIQVQQNATLKVGNNLDIGVATDVTMAVGGDFRVKVAGDYSVDAANINYKSQQSTNIQAVGAFSTKGSTVNIEAEGSANYLSGGETNMDYSQGRFGSGAAGANIVNNVDLTAPPQTVGLSPVVPFAIPPEREFEENTIAETPEDYDTPEGRAAAAEQARKDGVANAPAPVSTEQSAPQGGVDVKVPVKCDIIFSRREFTNDFRMSKNFTLGMMIDGGVGGRHRLVDQMLKDSKSSPERLYTVQEIVCNMAELAQNVLEPMLEVLPGGIGGYNNQWRLNSGYRLRGAIGNESQTSQHPKGQAVDIGILLPNRIEKTYEIIRAAEKILPYDQIILEYRFPSSVWIHASYNSKAPRKMAFTMVNDSVYARDSRGMPTGFALLQSIPPKRA